MSHIKDVVLKKANKTQVFDTKKSNSSEQI